MLKLIIVSAIVSISLVGTGIFIGVIYKNTVSNVAENCISQWLEFHCLVIMETTTLNA